MTTGFQDRILGPDTHANLPSAATTPEGSLYSCTDHEKVYRVTAGVWTDWLVLGSPGGGSPGPLLYLDSLALHADGDEFDDDQLTGWTLGGGLSTSNVTAVTTEDYDATCLDIIFAAQSARMTKAMSQADDIEISMTAYGYTNSTPSPTTAVASLIGLCFTDGSGNGIVMALYTSTANAWLWPLSGWSQTSGATAVGGIGPATVTGMLDSNYPFQLKLKKEGTLMTGSISHNGQSWFTATKTNSSTHTTMGIIRAFTGGGTNPRIRLGRFDVFDVS